LKHLNATATSPCTTPCTTAPSPKALRKLGRKVGELNPCGQLFVEPFVILVELFFAVYCDFKDHESTIKIHKNPKAEGKNNKSSKT